MKIYNLISLLVLTILLLSCSSSDDTTTNNPINPIEDKCQLKNVKILALVFDYNFYSTSRYQLYNPTFSNKFYFEYDNQNRMNLIKGGFIRLPSGQGGNYMFIDDSIENPVQSKISYDGNVVKVDRVPSISISYNNFSYINFETVFYAIENSKITKRKIISEDLKHELVYNYEYSENKVYEKLNDGKLLRTFYFEKGNLIKVETIYRDNISKEVYGKDEVIFLDYDSTKNYLKGKFYINGAFLNAFSENNFRKLEINKYSYQDNKFVLNSSYNQDIQFSYDSNGNANLFELNCKN